MHLIGQIGWILAAWKFGDWKHWQQYHATMLFFIVVSLLHDLITYNYPLWTFLDFWLPTHTLNSLAVTLIGFPCTVLIFLPHYPENSWIKKGFYLLFWVALYTSIEWLFVKIALFTYDNGWNIWRSVLFNVVLFYMLRLHYKRPLVAYVITIPLVVGYLYWVKLPIHSMK